jgi:hypothetical protein
MSKYYLIKDGDYDAVWGWDKVIELKKRGFVRVPYHVYVDHMIKVSGHPKPTKVSKNEDES